MNKRSILTILLVLVLNIQTAFAAVDGVELHSSQSEVGKPIHIAEIDPTKVSVAVEGLGGGQVCDAFYNAVTIDQIRQEDDFLLVANAHFFDGRARGDYIGNRIHFGPNFPSAQKEPDHVGITYDGTIVQGFGKMDFNTMDDYAFFYRGMYRINKGQSLAAMSDEEIQVRWQEVYSQYNISAPLAYTILAVNETENKLLILTAGDGKSRIGATPLEIIEQLVAVGATDAFILDSGKSTFLATTTELGNIVSNPSHVVPSLLVVRNREQLTETEVQNLPIVGCEAELSYPQPPSEAFGLLTVFANEDDEEMDFESKPAEYSDIAVVTEEFLDRSASAPDLNSIILFSVLVTAGTILVISIVVLLVLLRKKDN